jgi:IclR family acetate operon transcriptional repressor
MAKVISAPPDPISPVAMMARTSGSGASTDKVLSVLEAVVRPDGPHSLGEIADRAGLAKSSTHRLMGLLVEHGWVDARGAGRYGIGAHLRTLAAQVTSSDGPGRKILDELHTAVGGHTVHAALRSGDNAVYIQKRDGGRPYQMASRVGMSLQLHSTAIGKAILSRLLTVEVEAVIARTGLPGRTEATITRRGDLRRELAAVRAQGYAIDNEENETAIRCIAVPFGNSYGTVLGAVSVSTLRPLTTLDQLRRFRRPLREAADAFLVSLG